MNRKIKTWLQISDLLEKAQKSFERKSGWKSREVQNALNRFSRLDVQNKVLFGGLLVGQSLVGRVRTAGKKAPKSATGQGVKKQARASA